MTVVFGHARGQSPDTAPQDLSEPTIGRFARESAHAGVGVGHVRALTPDTAQGDSS